MKGKRQITIPLKQKPYINKIFTHGMIFKNKDYDAEKYPEQKNIIYMEAGEKQCLK